ncbi:MAG: hypothetical protein RL322_1437 [Pseudomonadota bacterium]|jgi:hypothetical protein
MLNTSADLGGDAESIVVGVNYPDRSTTTILAG